MKLGGQIELQRMQTNLAQLELEIKSLLEATKMKQAAQQPAQAMGPATVQ
jgi:hypothetical protein